MGQYCQLCLRLSFDVEIAILIKFIQMNRSTKRCANKLNNEFDMAYNFIFNYLIFVLHNQYLIGFHVEIE
jgi:hypothetical protein